MHREKNKNLAMITISAVILVAANLGVWMATKEGAIAPVGNSVLWGGFMALNIVSILWSVMLLGLQPMVVALSYVAGGFLAFKGVQGMGGISVAEVTTAGATYGAFGALAVGNATTKVRLAFFNKRQVPFIFVIAALLVLDAVLNSGISSADGSVVLNAVLFPFVLAGVIVGLVWSVLNRFGIGYNPGSAAAYTSNHQVKTAVSAEEAKTADSNALKIQVPDQAEVEEKVEPIAAVAATTVEAVEEPEPVVKETVAPAAVQDAKEEDFFPLEIDKGEEMALAQEDYEPSSNVMAEMDLDDDSESFSMSNFDSNLYAHGAIDTDHGNVMVDEPAAAVSLNLDEEKEEPVKAIEETKPEPVAEQTPEPVAEQKSQEKSSDWLSGHLDLLNKLK